MKTKLVVRPGLVIIRFVEKSFFSTILDFNPHWAHKHYNEYISQKTLNLCTTNEIRLKADIFDVSNVNGVQKPALYGFVIDTPPGFKVFCEPETIPYKKSILKTIKLYLETSNHEEVSLNREKLTYTLQLIKI